MITDVFYGMKISNAFKVAALVLAAATGFGAAAFAEPNGDYPSLKGERPRQQPKYVFVTGSMIPQKITVKSIGTATASQLRVIKRSEIDRTGRFTTEGVIAQDPSLRVISGHG